MNQGVSRRINSIPHKFELGKTWVFLAHRKGIRHLDRSVPIIDLNIHDHGITYEPAIFHVFKPTAIEYVVKPDDDEDKLERLVKKGVTLVQIQRLNEQGELVFKSESHRKLHNLLKWFKS
jgi:hypothetical protein